MRGEGEKKGQKLCHNIDSKTLVRSLGVRMGVNATFRSGGHGGKTRVKITHTLVSPCPTLNFSLERSVEETMRD